MFIELLFIFVQEPITCILIGTCFFFVVPERVFEFFVFKILRAEWLGNRIKTRPDTSQYTYAHTIVLQLDVTVFLVLKYPSQRVHTAYFLEILDKPSLPFC